MDGFRIIVIGASLGGVEALLRIAAELPRELQAAVFVTLHIGSNNSHLPSVVNSRGALLATGAEDGQSIVAGQIYIAPPDHHLLVCPDRVRLSRGPRENWVRPAIDPMFRTAAKSYGDRVIGVILTGRLNDGTAGLYEVKRRGGTTVVQDPADAVCPDMPASALAHVGADHRIPLSRVAAILIELSGEYARGEEPGVPLWSERR